MVLLSGIGRRSMKLAMASGVVVGSLNSFYIFVGNSGTALKFPSIVYAYTNGFFALIFGAVWLTPNSLLAFTRRPAAIHFARFWTLYRLSLCASFAFESYIGDATVCFRFAVLFLCIGLLKNYIAFTTFELEAVWWHGGFTEVTQTSFFDRFFKKVINFDLKVDRNYLSEREISQSSGIQSPFQGLQLTGNSAEALAVASYGLARERKVPLLNLAALRIFPGRMLGAGSSARVYLGSFRGTKCAAKMLFTVDISPDEIQRCCDEASLLFAIQKVSKNVVGLIGVAILPPSLCVVLELCSEGSLHDVLYKRRSARRSSTGAGHGQREDFAYCLTWEERLELALGACRGVSAVSTALPGYSHNDIKSANFLVHRGPSDNSSSSLSSTALVVKIADVEFASKGITPAHLLTWSTPNWTAPEVLSGVQPVSPKSDVFSLGCVLYEIFSRTIPFEGEQDGKTVAQNIINGMRPAFPEDITATGHSVNPPALFEVAVQKQFRSVIELTWAHDSEHRPASADLVSRLNQIRDEYVRSKLSTMNKRRVSESQKAKNQDAS